MFGSVFLIAFGGQLFGHWIKGYPIAFGKWVLSAIAMAFVLCGFSVAALGYNFRRAEGIPRQSSVTRRMVIFSFLWSLALSAVGFFTLGCDLSTSCLSWSNAQMAAVIALVSSALLSLMVLSA
jgi:cytochrome bd-type quinol oxidase subunit 2